MLVVCLVAFAPAPASAIIVGTNYNDFTDPNVEQVSEPEAATMIKQVGAKIHRFSVRWTAVQPDGPDQFLWARFDDMYAADTARGIKPLLVVSHAPYWAWPSDEVCMGAPSPSVAASCNVPPDSTGVVTHLAEYQTFIQALATRYPDAAGIEVWNEPNTDSQWKTASAKTSMLGGSPSEYVAVLQATYAGVQAAEATIGHDFPVVTGGMHMSQETDGAHTVPNEWMSYLYDDGAAGFYDKVGFHFYPKTIPVKPTTVAMVELGRTEDVVAARDPGHAFWVTETGYSTTAICRPDNVVHDPCTPEDQARGIPLAVNTLADDPDVEVALVFTLFNLTPDEGTEIQLGYGLVQRNLVPKPAYCSVALSWTGVDPCTQDPDHDGLANVYEAELSTDPNNPDTDGDGTLDGSDTRPLDPTRAGPQAAAPVLTSAPPAYTPERNTTFEFTTQLVGGTFKCSLDGAVFEFCSSPKTYPNLTQKQHTFAVRAVDADGVGGLTRTHKWTIDFKPPDTRIRSGPLALTADPNAYFTFSSTEPGTFECTLDGVPFTACSSPQSYTGLYGGTHTFAVRAIDLAGNVDPTPATWTWTVIGPPAPPTAPA